MKKLKTNPTLSDFQKYVAEAMKERGFDKETVPEMFMMLLEECGEFAKAARKSVGIKTDDKSEKFKLHEEASDVLTLLLDICNHYDIDLEKAFREKEEVNSRRVWK